MQRDAFTATVLPAHLRRMKILSAAPPQMMMMMVVCVLGGALPAPHGRPR